MAKRTNIRALRAITSNPGIRAAYRKQLETIIREMCDDVTDAVLEQYRSSFSRIARDSSPWRSPSEILGALCAGLYAKWDRKFAVLANAAADRLLKGIYRNIKTSRRNNLMEMGFNIRINPSRFTGDKYQALLRENVELIKSIPGQYLYRVEQAVQRSVSAGGDVFELGKRLSYTYGLEIHHAALIARDQTAKVTQALAESTDRDLGLTRGVWMHIPGRKESRPTHVEFDGRVFDLGKGLYDRNADGKNKGAWVKPGELILCMCTYRAIIPDTWRA